jgi:hypothetical protein
LPTQPGDQPWFGLSLSGRAQVRLVGPLHIEAGAELIAPLTRNPFDVRGQTTAVFQESSVAGCGFLGVGASIP